MSRNISTREPHQELKQLGAHDFASLPLLLLSRFSAASHVNVASENFSNAS